ncbi:MAG TPA: sialidase family protein [Mycobacteriales bacterium]|jgi:hypothetical protein|nr:sialidase family protein [Mycobacteriales bacterium]
MIRPRLLLLALVAPALAVLALPATASKPPARPAVSGLLPGTGNKRVNHNAEPALAAAPDGTLWATSNALATGCGRPTNCGSDIWSSRDGGRHWRWVANPFVTADPTGTYMMGGGDNDIAVAPEKNSSGHYNVYVASLWVSNSIAVSGDGGETWRVLPIESPPGTYGLFPMGAPATMPANAYADRPWIGADGPCTLLFAFNEVPGNQTLLQRYDACQAGLPVRDGASLPFGDTASVLGKVSGRFVVDTGARSPHRHAVYYPAVGSNKVFVQASTDGLTWTRHVVAPFSDDSTTVPIWPVTAAVDAAGRVYVAWHDTFHAYFASSGDGGATWTEPVRLDGARSTAAYPTVAAAGKGVVSVLWYGTARPGPANDPEGMGAPASKKGAVWQVYETRSSDGGRHFTKPVPVSGPVHRGIVCVGGGGCAADGSRNLLDDFGVVFVPGTSRVAAVYTTDQPGGQRVDRKTAYVALG